MKEKTYDSKYSRASVKCFKKSSDEDFDYFILAIELIESTNSDDKRTIQI